MCAGILAILKEGSRAPFSNETKEDAAQRRREALEALQATFSELGLDEKGESTRFSTNNERYVALKVISGSKIYFIFTGTIKYFRRQNNYIASI